MTAPPWGHKPPAVQDVEACWGQPPAEPSARLRYWLRRLDEGSWRPNKYLRREGYHASAQWLGVHLWEYLNVFSPVLTVFDWAEDPDLRRSYSPAYVASTLENARPLLRQYGLRRIEQRVLSGS